MSDNKPNPGSEEAITLGCKCPIMDNAYGKGYMCLPDVFVCNFTCPLHGKTCTYACTTTVNHPTPGYCGKPAGGDPPRCDSHYAMELEAPSIECPK